MNAFAAAAAALVADQNLGSAVTYARSGATWSPVAVRAVLSQPIEPYQLGDGAGIVAPHLEAMLPAAALPADPAEGDALTLADGAAYLVTTAMRDVTGAAWTLRLKDAAGTLTVGSGSGVTIGGSLISP